MNYNPIKNISIFLFLFFSFALFFSCGAEEEPVSISGHLIIGDEVKGDSPFSPTYVIISRTDDFDKILANPEKEIVAFKSAAFLEDHRYEVDLTETNLKSGDGIYLFGFIDNFYTEGIPSPKVGDYVGFYFDPDTMNPRFQLKAGENGGVDININRQVYEFDASVEGTISGNGDGEIILVAYAGDSPDGASDSGVPDIGSFNPDNVVGFSHIQKNNQSINYSLPILPYLPEGCNFPIENVYIFAVLDTDGDGKPTVGEKVGFYINDSTMSPTLVINEGVHQGIDISLNKVYQENNASIAGNISGDATGTVTVVAYQGSIDGMDADSFDSDKVIAYGKVVKPETDAITYFLDILTFYQFPINDVFVFAMIDTDEDSSPDEGEVIGFYSAGNSPMISVPDESVTGIDITLNNTRTYHEHDASIEGTIQCDFAGGDPEEITIIAYTGNMQDLGDESFTIDDVAAYTTVSINSSAPVPYAAKILPMFSLPLTDVYVFAFNDSSGDGEPGEGEKVGYYFNDTNSDLTIDVPPGGVTGIDITLSRTYHENDATIAGSISGDAIGIVTVVAYQGSIDGMDADSFDADKVVAYGEVAKWGTGTVAYSMDVLTFFQFPVEDVFVFAMIDKDNDGVPSDNDIVGFYSAGNSPMISISDESVTGIDITLNNTSTYNEHDVSIEGTIQCDFAGGDPEEITIIAYTGNMQDLGDGSFSIDDVAAYTTVSINSSAPVPYAAKILPTFELPLADVYVLAFNDSNGDGEPGDGEKVGYYFNDTNSDLTIDVPPEGVTGIDITLSRTYYDNNASIAGSISGSATGTVTVVAYQGSIDGMDADSFDSDNVVAYGEVAKPGIGTVTYSMDVLTFYQFPINDVLVFAMIDADGDGVPGDGEIVGFYSADNSPMISIPDEDVTGIDITLSRTYYENNASITGSISGSAAGTVTVVAYQGSIDGMDTGSFDLDKVVAYGEVTKPGTGTVAYSMDVLTFYQFPINDVFVFAMIDVDGDGVPSDDDPVGFYSAGNSPMISIPDESVTGIDITLNKTYHEHDVSIEGTIQCDFAGGDAEDITIIAYTGDMQDLSDGSFSLDDVAAYTTVSINSSFPVPYAAKILPMFNPPLTDVYVLAFNDANGDGEPGEGEKVGYYFNDATSELTINVPSEGVSGVDIILSRTYYENDATIAGSISGSAAGPVTVVAYQGSIDTMDADSFDADKVVAYGEVAKPGTGTVAYSMDVLTFYQFPINDVFVFAMIDADGDGVPGDGEIVGYYSVGNSPVISIPDKNAAVTGIDIILDKTYREHDVSITGDVLGDATGEITLVAYAGALDEGIGIDSFDSDSVVAYKKIEKQAAGPMAYTLKILPLFDLPISDVYVFALKDEDGDGQPGDGELLGYYFDGTSMDLTIDLPAPDPPGSTVIVSNINIELDRVYKDPDTAWTLRGTVSLSNNAAWSGATTSDLLIMAYSGTLDSVEQGTVEDENVVVYAKIKAADISAAGGYPYYYSVKALPFEFNSDANKVNVFAVLDVNGSGGPDVGDRMGLFLDNDLNSTVTLPTTSNVNVKINKIMYDHDSSIMTRVGYEHIGGTSVTGREIILIAIHEDGILDPIVSPFATFYLTDVDKVVGMKKVVLLPPEDPYDDRCITPFYEFPILTILDDEISGPFPMDIYIYAVFDEDMNGYDEEDPFGYFPETFPFWTAGIYRLTSQNQQVLPYPQGVWFPNN